MSTELDRAERIMEDCWDNDDAVGMIRSGDVNGGPHSSLYVCGSDLHQQAARIVCEETTGLPARFVPFGGES